MWIFLIKLFSRSFEIYKGIINRFFCYFLRYRFMEVGPNFRFKYKHQEPNGHLIIPAYRPSSERKRTDMIYYPGS